MATDILVLSDPWKKWNGCADGESPNPQFLDSALQSQQHIDSKTVALPKLDVDS